jgi:GT2 family glycosyltransferase
VTLAIVTPWQDHLELEPDYFAAIEAGKPDQLVIVDDRSEQPLPFAAARIEPGQPGGFSRANNLGLTLVETDHVLFLNNDVRPLRPSWLDEIRAAVEPGVLRGPLIERNPLSLVDDVYWPYIDGWCVALTTEDARKLGGWDERYDEAGPGYYSDNALSHHARQLGFWLRELRPGLHHKGGQTGGSGPAFEYALKVNGPLFAEQVRQAL